MVILISYVLNTNTSRKSDTVILYDLAILLSGVFNFKFLDKISALKLLPHKINIQNATFNLTEEAESVITSLSKAESKNKLIMLLKKYFIMLKLLKRYKISLSLLEFVQLFIQSCEMFNTSNEAHIFYTDEKEDITSYFYFRVFSRVHELTKQLNLEPLEYKSYFLSTLFGLSILSPDEIMQTPYTLTKVIENIGNLIKNPYIYEYIQEIDNFVSDIISENICRYQEFNMQYAIHNDTLDIILEIQNNSNYVLQNFVYELLWSPKKKIQLIKEKNSARSQDLHDKVKKTYLFTINNKRSLPFHVESHLLTRYFKIRQ